jgi:hypothetical protein
MEDRNIYEFTGKPKKKRPADKHPIRTKFLIWLGKTRLTAIWGILLVVAGVAYCPYGFLTGQYFGGKASSGEYTDFENYGKGAFAANSVLYLGVFGWGLALVGGIAIAYLVRSESFKQKAIKVLLPVFPVVGYLFNLAAIVLLAVYQNSGIPFENFEDDSQSDAINYGLTYLILVFFIAAATFVLLVGKRVTDKRRPAAIRTKA